MTVNEKSNQNLDLTLQKCKKHCDSLQKLAISFFNIYLGMRGYSYI